MSDVMEYTDDQLSAWLDERLPVELMTEVEQSLRDSESLRQRVARLIRRRDEGWHSLGDIWRQYQLTCPSRQELSRWLLGTLPPDEEAYIEFHLRTIGCRYCHANWTDLVEAAENPPDQSRRRRFFQSSAGHLPERHT